MGLDEFVTAPAVVAFDVNETMFDLAGLGPAFADAGLPAEAVPLWFARVLRDGFALTVLGDYRPFSALGTAGLRGLRPELSEADASAVIARFAELDPHPDVEPALRRLADAGVRAVTLTNGSAEVTRTLLARAGLSSYVETPLSVDAVRRWKPAPEPYRYAAQACGVAPGQVALVAAHAWDCAGARRAGLRSGWVSRLEGREPAAFAGAEVTGDRLDEVVAQLLRS